MNNNNIFYEDRIMTYEEKERRNKANQITENMTVMDMIRESKRIAIDNFRFPNLAKVQPQSSFYTRIRTIEKIGSEVIDGNDDFYKTGNIKRYSEAKLRVYLVFNVSNELNPDCLTGECDICPMDSIAAITIPITRNSAVVDYWIMLSRKASDYIKNDVSYVMRNTVSDDLYERVSTKAELNLLTWNDIMSSEKLKSRVPKKIMNVLDSVNLTGGYKRELVDGMDPSTGMRSRYYEETWCEGILQKIELPEDH